MVYRAYFHTKKSGNNTLGAKYLSTQCLEVYSVGCIWRTSNLGQGGEFMSRASLIRVAQCKSHYTSPYTTYLPRPLAKFMFLSIAGNQFWHAKLPSQVCPSTGWSLVDVQEQAHVVLWKSAAKHDQTISRSKSHILVSYGCYVSHLLIYQLGW
jgi:hypothetical protein